uniref:Uncharacterized protein n=1 Tax=Megaselia scalaris TaxID=36166 RepID=T1GZG4_MEGSC
MDTWVYSGRSSDLSQGWPLHVLYMMLEMLKSQTHSFIQPYNGIQDKIPFLMIPVKNLGAKFILQILAIFDSRTDTSLLNDKVVDHLGINGL